MLQWDSAFKAVHTGGKSLSPCLSALLLSLRESLFPPMLPIFPTKYSLWGCCLHLKAAAGDAEAIIVTICGRVSRFDQLRAVRISASVGIADELALLPQGVEH